MILRTLYLHSQIETRGCLKCDVFGWGEAIAAGVQTAGAVYNNERSLALQKAMFEAQQDWAAESFYKNLEFEHKMTNQAQDFQREMWQRQIDYNDPSAQIQRLMDAGINPNAAAGMVSAGGAAASGSVSAPSGASAAMPSGSVPHLSNPFESLSELPMRLLQQDAVKQQIDTEKSKQNLNESQARNLDEQTKGLIIDNDWKPFEKEASLESSYAQIDLWEKQGDVNVAQATQIREMLPYLKLLNVAQQHKLFSETLYALKQAGKIDYEINLLSAQIETELHKQKQMDAATYQAYMSGLESKSVIELNGVKMSVEQANERLTSLKADRQKAQNAYEDILRAKGINPDEHNPFVAMFNQTGQVLQQLENNYNAFDSAVTSNVKKVWQSVRGCYDKVQLQLHSYGDDLQDVGDSLDSLPKLR